MKSFKNHASLVLALFAILFSIQAFFITERTITAYKQELAANYSLVLVSEKKLPLEDIVKQHKAIKAIEKLEADSVIEKLDTKLSTKSVELLKLTLPKFYKIVLAYYPSPSDLKILTKDLYKYPQVTKIETFSKAHDTTYKLLLLFKKVVVIFAFIIIFATVLLISKELKIWQYKHNERMNIMGLFGAPSWLRSAVLYRMAIVDALIAFVFAFITFSYLASTAWIAEEFKTLGIAPVVFSPLVDSSILFAVAFTLSITLATFVVLSHKEEV